LKKYVKSLKEVIYFTEQLCAINVNIGTICYICYFQALNWCQSF